MDPRWSKRGDLDGVTQEEVSKLAKAMKDDQFRGYMDEYCKETSDPKHRKEYLQYLDQLEAKGEMPEGQALLRTQPGCCVKTHILFKNGQLQKLFINIVHSDQLDDFRIDEAPGGGKKVHLPYSLSPPRPDQDHNKDYCMTCDLAVSSRTYFQGMQNPQILKLLVDTAAEGLGTTFLKGFEEVKRDFKLMQRMPCKGGYPMPMSVKLELLKDGGKKMPPPRKPRPGDQDAVTPSELRQMRQEARDKKIKVKEDDEREALERQRAKERAIRKAAKAEVEEATKAAHRIRVPKHQLVHVGELNLTDFMESNQIQTSPIAMVPRHLRLVIELPTVTKVADVNLEVTCHNVLVEVIDKYYLDLPLPYEVDDLKGSAKFDKMKQTLTLELPVKPKPPDPAILEGMVDENEEEASTKGGGLREPMGMDSEDQCKGNKQLKGMVDENEEEASTKGGGLREPMGMDSEDPQPAIEKFEPVWSSLAEREHKVLPDGPLRKFVDTTEALRTAVAMEQCDVSIEDFQANYPAEWHQTRQNVTLLFELEAGEQLCDVQLSLHDRRLLLSFCSRPAAGGRWRRHWLRRLLFGDVDPRQCHANLEPEEPLRHSGESAQDFTLRRQLVIVLRKVDQMEPWSEVWSSLAEREHNVLPDGPLRTCVDTTEDVRPRHAESTDLEAFGRHSCRGTRQHLSEGFRGGAADALPLVGEYVTDAEVVPLGAAVAAVAQSACVMGQSVLLRTRLMYSLL